MNNYYIVYGCFPDGETSTKVDGFNFSWNTLNNHLREGKYGFPKTTLIRIRDNEILKGKIIKPFPSRSSRRKYEIYLSTFDEFK